MTFLSFCLLLAFCLDTWLVICTVSRHSHTDYFQDGSGSSFCPILALNCQSGLDTLLVNCENFKASPSLHVHLFISFNVHLCAFSALTLLVGRQEGHPACKKTEWWGAGVVICLERDADLHTAQLLPLPLTVSCFSKIQIGFTFVVPAYQWCIGGYTWVYRVYQPPGFFDSVYSPQWS